MCLVCLQDEIIDVEFPELINTDDLVSDYIFQYQMYRMNLELDIDYEMDESSFDQ